MSNSSLASTRLDHAPMRSWLVPDISSQIGSGIASGIGMTVGSLVTGVTAIPTAGLGILIGAGTGLVHGPWVKFTELSKTYGESSVMGSLCCLPSC